MYRKAQEADLAAVRALWAELFGDSDEWIRDNLKGFVGAGHTYLAEEEEGAAPQAVLHAVPCVAGGRKGVYLYALATSPAQQGKGIMTGLIQYAEQSVAEKGAAFACLIPASAPLFQYYVKRGYTLEGRLRYLTKPIQANLLATASFDTLTAKALGAAREKYFPEGYVAFAPQATAALLGDLYAEGISTAETPHGYALYFVRDGALLVAEMGALSTPHANLLLQAIREKEGCEEAALTLAANSELYSGEGKIAPHALFKQLDSSHQREAPYLRFAFEEARKEPLL